MAVIGIDHYNIKSSAEMMIEIRKFYCEVLGLIEGFRPPFQSVGHWLYASNHPIIHLGIKEDDETNRTEVTTIDHIALSCVDFAGMRDKLDSLGISYKVKEVPQRNQMQIFLSDPVGNGVELNFAQSE